MAIIDTLTESNFCDRMKAIRPGNFTWEGLKALYQYYEDLSNDTEQDIEFDPIALCCEWTEYSDFDEIRAEYSDVETLDDMDCFCIELDSGSFLVQHG